ncbi:unnamed protein product [Sphagnum troendelagicum]|uniref:Uncharacterized protein n=1 Tax=Sphagnum troendelagicum TaxID=128251 RepID=A0ABP0U4N6_9BRYO
MKFDGIKQEPKERVQRYFERLDKLFQRGRIPDAERRRRFLGLGHSEDKCWKKPRDGKMDPRSANFLEVMLNDEKVTLHQLNELCGSESLFSYTRIPRRRTPVEATPTASGLTVDAAIVGAEGSQEGTVKSKIFSHFIKGKISLMPMETVMMLPGELEHLENLVKVVRRKDTETASTQVTMVSAVPTFRRPSGSVSGEHHDHCTQEQTVGISGVMKEAPCFHPQDEDERLSELDSSSDFGHSEESKEEDQTRGTDEGGSEFGNTELENLILKEGPQQILQLILQDKADDLLKEEITDEEDYADSIRWAAEEEQQMQNLSEAGIAAEESVLLQLQQMEVADSNGCVEERCAQVIWRTLAE